jgi:ADP-heptose:LPS heptosyltransferase
LNKRILIVRTDRVGDVIMITPMIREIRKTYPDCFLATLTNRNSSEILINNPYLDKIILDDLDKKSFWKVVKELRNYKFTDGLLVLPTERAAYQMFFSGIKNRVGVGKKIYEVITLMKSVSRNKYIPLRHEADYCMDMARNVGVKSDNLSPEIFLTENEIKDGKEFLKENGVYTEDFKILIHTGSGNSSPNWSENKYLELINRILTKFENKKFKIILTAHEMSNDFKNNIKSLDKGIINIEGKIKSLRDLIMIINSVNLVIASSTGPAHIAAALRINAVVLYCHRPMNCSKIWGTLSDNAINIEVSDEHCKKFCVPNDNICDIENGITVDDVLKNINF